MNKEKAEVVRGFKVFDEDWSCRGFQYAVGQIYTHEGEITPCYAGFHFCLEVADCFNYYSFNPANKIAEVIAHGEIVGNGDKVVTNILEIVREVSWEEMLRLANAGNHNVGFRNSGNRNSGNFNSGSRNSGSRNNGDHNSGEWNLSDYSTGCFNTETRPLHFFDKETEITWDEWRWHRGRRVLNGFYYCPAEWVWADDMTDAEKAENRHWEVTDGYLKVNPQSHNEAFQEFWNNLKACEKADVLTIPNFDAVKFQQITGVDVYG